MTASPRKIATLIVLAVLFAAYVWLDMSGWATFMALCFLTVLLIPNYGSTPQNRKP